MQEISQQEGPEESLRHPQLPLFLSLLRIPRPHSHVEGRRPDSLAGLVGGSRTCGACHPPGESGTAGTGAPDAPTWSPSCQCFLCARPKGSLPSSSLPSPGTTTSNGSAGSNFTTWFLMKASVLTTQVVYSHGRKCTKKSRAQTASANT
jgi:hypothetical protein